jgi:hypothetical protein
MMRAEASIKSIVMGLVVFSLLIAAGTLFMTNTIVDNDMSTSSDMQKVSLLSGKAGNFTAKITREHVNNSGFVAQISDRIYDTWLGKVISSVTVIYDSYGLFTEYVFTLGGILELPDFIIGFIQTMLFLLVTFAVIYFIRSGK